MQYATILCPTAPADEPASCGGVTELVIVATAALAAVCVLAIVIWRKLKEKKAKADVDK